MTEVYQVWALGYDAEGMSTEYEEFLGEFTDLAEARDHAEKFRDISYVYEQDVLDGMMDGEYMQIKIEVMQPIPEDEREGLGPDDETWEVVDIIYERDIYLPGDPRAEVADE